MLWWFLILRTPFCWWQRRRSRTKYQRTRGPKDQDVGATAAAAATAIVHPKDFRSTSRIGRSRQLFWIGTTRWPTGSCAPRPRSPALNTRSGRFELKENPTKWWCGGGCDGRTKRSSEALDFLPNPPTITLPPPHPRHRPLFRSPVSRSPVSLSLSLSLSVAYSILQQRQPTDEVTVGHRPWTEQFVGHGFQSQRYDIQSLWKQVGTGCWWTTSSSAAATAAGAGAGAATCTSTTHQTHPSEKSFRLQRDLRHTSPYSQTGQVLFNSSILVCWSILYSFFSGYSVVT